MTLLVTHENVRREVVKSDRHMDYILSANLIN